jgi:hypothetical protein
MAAWINSPPHRENLEFPSFRAIGVGVAADPSGRLYWVQDFGSVVVAAGTTPPPPAAPPAPSPTPPATPPPPLVPPPAPVVPPAVVVSPPAPAPPAVASAATGPAPVAAALTPQRAEQTQHRLRGPRLLAAKPHAGDPYRARLSFGRVPVATAALSLHCHARIAGRLLRGTGEIAGHVATCTWRIPARAGGKRLLVRVKVSGRHGVSLVRSARLLVA